jgi:hypothetical protein
MPDPSATGREEAVERRASRSSDPLVALSRLLEATRMRSGASTVALADETGLCIAGAGDASLCEDLASRGPLLAARPVNDTIPCRLDVVERAMQVRRLRIDGIEVLLCAEGPHPVDMTDAEEGSKRILGRQKARGT